MKIDTTNWRWFQFDRIFIIRKGFYNKKPEHSILGNIPFLGAIDNNNGISEYYTYEDIDNATKTGDEKNDPIEKKLFPGNAVCVTNNGSVGYAYYQKNPFTCSHDVNPLYRKDGDFNEYTGLFVATVIMHDRYRWGYGRKWRPERMALSKLKLPSTKENKPDWDYMEEYIKNLKSKHIITGNKTRKINDISTWKSFVFGDLLKNDNVYKAKANIKIDLNYSDNSSETIDLPYISRTERNNGVDCFVNRNDIINVEKGNAIVIGDTTSTISYQPNEFTTGDHIIVIRADWLNKYTGLFLVSLLNKERFRYCYGRAFLKDLVMKTELILPVTPDNKPDWEYMEEYIKSLPFGDRI